MTFTKTAQYHRLLMILLVIGTFATAVFAAPTVTISSCTPTNPNAHKFCASASGGTITKVVFYKNDVPYETDTTSTYQMTEEILGQDTYTYRARAYDSTGDFGDSNEIKFTVNTPEVLWMGTTIPGTTHDLQEPGVTLDHSDDIQAALDYLSTDGGTLFFPCTLAPDGGPAVYNIKKTIRVPPNVTLQGEGSERWGRCRIYWYEHGADYGPIRTDLKDTTCGSTPPIGLRNRPMFQIIGGSNHVRFRDLAFYSRTSGNECYARNDYDTIAADQTSAIEMNPSVSVGCFSDQTQCNSSTGGHISDVILENVSINDFTNGVKAVSHANTSYGVSKVKIRGYAANTNHRQMYLDAPYIYDWDVQNFNIAGMVPLQAGIQIEKTGYPSGYTGMNPGLKFLMLNCNGTKPVRPAFCVQVKKHGGLYFRQMHHEGAERAIDVVPHSVDNPDPIIFESGIASGRFQDESMKLYLVGNGIQAPDAVATGLDNARLRFEGDGLASTVVDCGDVHSDWTDTQLDGNPSNTTTWGDLRMLSTHTERNRASFFAQESSGLKYIKNHKYCVQGDPVIPDANKIGGLYFDNGILPTEAGVYSITINEGALPSECMAPIIPLTNAECIEYFLHKVSTPAVGGSVYLVGQFTIDRTIEVPRGSQLIGAPEASLTLEHSGGETGEPLLKMVIPINANNQFPHAGTVIRDLILDTVSEGKTGIEMINEEANAIGVSRDIHFSRLTIKNFVTGILARAHKDYLDEEPMIDGISLKQMTFQNNTTAVRIDSNNASNWNVMNVFMETGASNQVGWHQIGSGHQGLQNVACVGIANAKRMEHCVKLEMIGGFFMTDFKKPVFTNSSITVDENYNAGEGVYAARQASTLMLRDGDFTSSIKSPNNVTLRGKSFITSMNNKYSNFSITSDDHEADLSRVTYCGDTYSGNVYDGIAPRYKNLWVGVETPTLVACGPNPIPWKDPVTLGGQTGDVPLVGNFKHSVEEDIVVFRQETMTLPPAFIIKTTDGKSEKRVEVGVDGDIPLIGKFYPGEDSRVVVYTPSTGVWSHVDPMVDPLPTPATYSFGLPCTPPDPCDVPFIGNFFDESATGDEDEIAIYRPDTQTFWIVNPRTNETRTHVMPADYGEIIKVGNFLGDTNGHQQIAQFVAGTWYILDGDTGATTSRSWGQVDDVPVPGEYLPPSSGFAPQCTQLAVWRPDDEKFYITDGDISCGSRTDEMIWGSNNDRVIPSTSFFQAAADDIPLSIRNASGISMPASYRPDKGVFPYSVANGQWWIHDAF